MRALDLVLLVLFEQIVPGRAGLVEGVK